LPLADVLIVSWIGQAFAGDAFFPDFTEQPFTLVDSRPLAAALPVTIRTYRRTQPLEVSSREEGP
jgi:hypothetical protein